MKISLCAGAFRRAGEHPAYLRAFRPPNARNSMNPPVLTTDANPSVPIVCPHTGQRSSRRPLAADLSCGAGLLRDQMQGDPQ